MSEYERASKLNESFGDLPSFRQRVCVCRENMKVSRNSCVLFAFRRLRDNFGSSFKVHW